MKGFLEEYGLIIVVVAVVLGMLTFGKSSYAKSIQDAILGSTDHIVETGENITKEEVHVTPGDALDIEGTKYVVLEGRENSQALVMTSDSIGDRSFHSYSSDCLRQDGQYISTYEGSDIDNYLENEWYNNLSSTMKAAIQTTSIKQASYVNERDPDSKQETGPNGQVYNTISRHAFLPSVSEIGKTVDLKNSDKIKAFLNGTHIWTRDSYRYGAHYAEYLHKGGMLYYNEVYRGDMGVRPAFVIDLSKVDYTEVEHVDYK